MKKIEQRTMTDKELLQEYIRIAITHVKRMKAAFTYLKNTVPLKDGDIENLTDMQVAFIDQIINRFAQLQDLIGAKIFPLILEILEEDSDRQTMIDKLNTLEKIEFLPSVDDWRDLRDIRNTVSHQYPQNDSYMVIHINKILNAAITLLDYWQELCKKLDGVLEKAK